MKSKILQTACLFVQILILMITCSSCSFGKYDIKPCTIPQPISMTPVTILKDGSYYKPREDEKVHHFVFKKRHWWFFYAVPLTKGQYDFSQDIQKIIEDHNGDGVVNLKVHAQSDWYDYFSALVPVIPSYLLVTVEGDVIAMKE